MSRALAGRYAALTAALAVTVTGAVTGCTGSPEPDQAPPAATPAASPSTSVEPAAIVKGPAGRTYRIRINGDRTDVTLTGGPGEQLRRTFGTPGRYVAPQVVPGGPLEGLSPDGSWLVLESHAPAPKERSVFLILTGLLRLERDTIDLPGRFTFDAWSPAGDVLYLIEHQPPAGSGHYVVRAYDMQQQALRPDPVVDKRNVDEEMAGQPVARAATPDGAVVATLYRRQGDNHADADEHGPFVHLLFAAEGAALCVDLPAGTTVGDGWTVRNAGDRFVLARPSGDTAFTIDPQDGGLERA